MVPSANFLLSKLPVYTGTEKLIVSNQGIGDIKRAIQDRFEMDKLDYASIAPYFVGDTVLETCRNVYDFLRENVRNVMESGELQRVKSPAAIIATGQTTGGDCKNYSLFAAGILDAINRSGIQKIPLAFRYAKYKSWNGIISDHVFVVAYPGTNKEIWIDGIDDVEYFNQQKQPDYFTDKKINSMALVSVSGMGLLTDQQLYQGLQMERASKLASGKMKYGDATDRQYMGYIQAMGAMVGDTSTDNTLAAGADTLLPGTGTILTSFLGVLNAKHATTIQPGGDDASNDLNNWQKWNSHDAGYSNTKYGSSAAYWSTNTFGNLPYEAANLLSWLNTEGQKGYNAALSAGATKQGIINKLISGGIPAASVNTIMSELTGTSVTTTGTATATTATTATGSSNILLYLIAIGVVAKMAKII